MDNLELIRIDTALVAAAQKLTKARLRAATNVGTAQDAIDMALYENDVNDLIALHEKAAAK